MRSRWGVLISGNGSTLQALLECRDLCDIGVIVSSTEKAYGVLRARRAGVPVEILPASLKGAAMRAEAEAWILEKLNKYNIENVFLAGFMKIVSNNFIDTYKGRLFNIHPSLLPKHKGLNAFEEALKAGESTAGVTVHHVNEEVDSGEFILQREFDIPKHRDNNLSHLWLHIQEQRVLRESLRKILWPKTMM